MSNPTVKAFAWVVGIVIALSLFGQGSLAGLFGVGGLLVAILLLMVRSARPSGRKAHRVTALQRYQDLAEPGTLGGILLTAAAAATALDVFGADPSAYFGVGVLLGAGYLFLRGPTALVTAAVGCVAAIASIFVRHGCSELVSRSGRTVYFAALAGMAVVVLLARLRPFPTPLARRRTLPQQLLIVFGLLDLATFAVHPAGVDIWEGTDWYVSWGVVAGVALIALLTVYAADIVLSLVGIGVLFADAYLAIVEAGYIGHNDPCGDPTLAVAFIAAFGIAMVFAMSLAPGSSRR